MTGPHQGLRLPKQVEASPRAASVAAALSDTRPLWSGGDLRMSVVELSGRLGRSLKSAHTARRVTRGLESAEKKLSGESRGLEHVDRRSGITRGQRVSRLIVVANDGAERMYRRVETLLRKHPGRLLVLQLKSSSDELGSLLFGPSGSAKLLMLDHKDAVADALLALVDSPEDAEAECSTPEGR